MTPDSPAAEVRYLRERGELQAAVEAFGPLTTERAAASADLELLEQLGRTFALLGDAKRTEICFERCVELLPARAALYRCQIGWFYQKQKRWTRALSWYERSLATFPDYHICLFRVGYCLERLHRPLAAATALQRAAGSWDSGSKKQKERSQPIQIQVLFHLARCLRESGDCSAAHAALDRLESLFDPKISPIIKRSHRLTSRAEIFLDEGRGTEALASLLEATMLEPDSAVISERTARAFGLLGRFEDAEQAFQRALHLPRSYTVAPRVAAWLRQHGRYAESARCLTNARTAVGEPDVMLVLEEALLQRDLGRPTAGLVTLDSLSLGRVAPNSQLRGRLDVVRAELYANLGEVDRARTILDSIQSEGLTLREVAALRVRLENHDPAEVPARSHDRDLPPELLRFGLSYTTPRETGRIARWYPNRAFGFIVGDGDPTDASGLFFHASTFEHAELADLRPELGVSYIRVVDPLSRKTRAERVRLEPRLALAKGAGSQ